MKRIVKIIAVAVLGMAVVLLGLRAIGFELARNPPDRHENVPEDAEWVGGADGGVWIKCVEVSESRPQQFRCDIYGENGSVWLSDGRFQSFQVTWDRNSNRPIYSEARLDKLDHNGWDGQTIHLRNGYALRLIR